MNNSLKIIKEENILNKKFRAYGTANEPLFLAKDVAEWIEHSNSRIMIQQIDNEEKVVKNVYTHGGVQEAWFLTEYGLYEVLMLSRKPIAKAFKTEVKKILKELRLTVQKEYNPDNSQLLSIIENLSNALNSALTSDNIHSTLSAVPRYVMHNGCRQSTQRTVWNMGGGRVGLELPMFFAAACGIEAGQKVTTACRNGKIEIIP
jgi:prophage antirepressor-like protein